jgi:hypothetical protein
MAPTPDDEYIVRRLGIRAAPSGLPLGVIGKRVVDETGEAIAVH